MEDAEEDGQQSCRKWVPRVLGSNHLSCRADRPGATWADARLDFQGPGSQSLLHPLESLEMIIS